MHTVSSLAAVRLLFDICPLYKLSVLTGSVWIKLNVVEGGHVLQTDWQALAKLSTPFFSPLPSLFKKVFFNFTLSSLCFHVSLFCCNSNTSLYLILTQMFALLWWKESYFTQDTVVPLCCSADASVCTDVTCLWDSIYEQILFLICKASMFKTFVVGIRVTATINVLLKLVTLSNQLHLQMGYMTSQCF